MTLWRANRWANKTLEERFWEKVERRGPDECWPWIAGRAHGYGSFGIGDGKIERAHVVAWTLTHGPRPAGAEIHHLCRRKECCNPSHLAMLPMREHRALHIYERRTGMTHCPNGHEYTPESTGSGVAYGKIGRRCLICREATAARSHAAAKERRARHRES